MYSPCRRIDLDHVDVDESFVRVEDWFAFTVEPPTRFAFEPALASVEVGHSRVGSGASEEKWVGLDGCIDVVFVPIDVIGLVEVSRDFFDDVLPPGLEKGSGEVPHPKHQTSRKKTVSSGYKLICCKRSCRTGSSKVS